MTGFIDVIAPLIDREGGYVNRSTDRGGPTNMGITQRVYSGWLASRGLAWRDVKNITRAEVIEIYRDLYWELARCDSMPELVRELHFDTAVNHGVYRAAKMMQQAAGVRVDGSMGPVTMDAVESMSPELLRARYVVARYRFYGEIVANDETQMDNIDGWLRRMRHFSA